MRDALPVLQRLAGAGHDAYFVGGCVRDALLGRPVSDVDIASSALPGEVVSLFERTVPTGMKHGTVTVVLEGRSYEVTTFRTESGYEDHRRPSEVAFIRDLRGDLERRDFTINAMALDAGGRLHDPFGGLADLQDGVVRCVGEAEERFREDALRMLRAVRFAAAFRFRVAKSTWRALGLCRPLLAHVAMERVGAELDKMLGGGEPDRALALLWRSGLLRHAKRPLAPLPAARCGLPPVDGLAGTDERWAAVLLGLGAKPEQARGLLGGLAFGARRAGRVAAALAVHEAVKDDATADAGPAAVRAQCAMADAGPAAVRAQCAMADAGPAAVRAESAMADAGPAAVRGGGVTASAGPTETALGIGGARVRWTSAVIANGREAAGDWLAIMQALAGRGPDDGGFARIDRAYVDSAAEWLEAMPAAAVKELEIGGADLLAAAGREPGEWVRDALGWLLLRCALGIVPNNKEALLEAFRRRPALDGEKGPPE